MAAPGIQLSVFLGEHKLKTQSGPKNYAGYRRSIGVITQILHYFFNKIESAQQAEPSCDHHHRYLDSRHE